MTNVAPFDKWTPLHGAVGALAGAAGVSPPAFLALVVGFEIFESTLETPGGSALFGTKRPESARNVAVDLAVSVGAYALVRSLR